MSNPLYWCIDVVRSEKNGLNPTFFWGSTPVISTITETA
nr:MAG TPA: hypothetical protein [Caudoviricetes sp.]